MICLLGDIWPLYAAIFFKSEVMNVRPAVKIIGRL